MDKPRKVKEELLKLSFHKGNAAALAKALTAKAATQSLALEARVALAVLADAITAAKRGAAKVPKASAFAAFPVIVETVESAFAGGLPGTGTSADDLRDIVLQIQDRFRLAFTIRDEGTIETVFVGTGPAHHRRLAGIALNALGIDDLFTVAYRTPLALDLDEIAPAARDPHAAKLIATMPGEMRHELESVRAAIAALSAQGSVTVALR